VDLLCTKIEWARGEIQAGRSQQRFYYDDIVFELEKRGYGVTLYLINPVATYEESASALYWSEVWVPGVIDNNVE
jgi:hypothetical protein